MKKGKWINFLNEFTKGICNTDISQNDKGHYLLETTEIFGLGITLSTKYGFLEISFPNNQAQIDFLYFSNISKKTTKKNSVEIVKTKWENSDFPCRVFVEKRKIQFYDKTNDLPLKEEFEKRITILQSIFKILTNMKLLDSLPDDIKFSI